MNNTTDPIMIVSSYRGQDEVLGKYYGLGDLHPSDGEDLFAYRWILWVYTKKGQVEFDMNLIGEDENRRFNFAESKVVKMALDVAIKAFGMNSNKETCDFLESISLENIR